MERYYNIAGDSIRISCDDEFMFLQEGKLGKFFTEADENARTIEFQVVTHLTEAVGNCIYTSPGKWVFKKKDMVIRYIGSLQNGLSGAYLRICRQGTHTTVEVKEKSIRGHITSNLVLNSLEAEHHLLLKKTLILHASYIEKERKAILFTAPSGVGKSTQAELWKSFRNASIVNGDRAAIKIADGKVYAAGIPFSGSSSYCENKTLPVEAIVYLEQKDSTVISKMEGMKAFRKIWEGITINMWEPEDMKKGANLIEEIIRRIPIFHLACTPDITAVQALENALKSEIL